MQAEEQETHFQRWLRDHVGLMLKVVRAFAESPHDQDDLFQDVLVNLWSSIPNFRGVSKETTWIYRVSFNTALVWQRGERRRHRHHDLFAQCEATAKAPTSSSNEQLSHETINRLYAAIRQLSKVDASLTTDAPRWTELPGDVRSPRHLRELHRGETNPHPQTTGGSTQRRDQ